MDRQRQAYLDANAIISLMEDENSDVVFLTEIAAIGLIRLVTSELTMTEVLVSPIRDEDETLMSGYERLLSGEYGIDVAQVDRAVLRRAADLRATIGGKTPDAIHVATASLNACDIVVSSDRRLRLPTGMSRLAIQDIATIPLP